MDNRLTITYPPPNKPWSTNQDRNYSPHVRAQLIKSWKTAAYLHLRTAPHPTSSRWLVQLTIPFTSNRRRDPHNYCGTVLKATIDALVLAEWVPDDTPEWIAHREPRLVKGGDVILELHPVTQPCPCPLVEDVK